MNSTIPWSVALIRCWDSSGMRVPAMRDKASTAPLSKVWDLTEMTISRRDTPRDVSPPLSPVNRKHGGE